MENGKADPNSVNQDENPGININNSTNNVDSSAGRHGGGDAGRRRTPFTDLSQVDADLALARTLQEQERAYMTIRMNNAEGGDYVGWEDGSYGLGEEQYEDFDDASEEEYEGSHAFDDDDEEEEEDAFDVHAHDQVDGDGSQDFEIDPSAFSNDEAYARALQEAEGRVMAARMLAMTGINTMDIGEAEDEEDHRGNTQDVWAEVDPDELSYEELTALGEVVGTENRGLSANTIALLPSISYKSQGTQDGSSDSCVICRLDYEDDDTVTVLSCKHSYHSDCINHWLQINKVCPVCSAEVSTTKNS